MLTLYGNAFSPFARKVRIAMRHKALEFRDFDGLLRANHAALRALNGRVEVPVLEHDGLVVVNSADIVAYLERVFPDRPVYPQDHAAWVKARTWERCSDSVIDAILIDVSYWVWAIRPDSMPAGLLDAARADMTRIYDALEQQMEGDFVCGALSIADMALFPQLSATRMLEVPIDGERHPKLLAWYKRCRGEAIFAEDLERLKAYLAEPTSLDVEREKIFWRGDRIEWMLARGQHRWLVNEIEEGRAVFPGLGVPVSPKRG